MGGAGCLDEGCLAAAIPEDEGFDSLEVVVDVEAVVTAEELEIFRRWVTERVVIGGRVLSGICTVAVEELESPEVWEGGRRVVAPVNDVMEDFVRAWPEGARTLRGVVLPGRPEEVVGRDMDPDLVRGPDDEVPVPVTVPVMGTRVLAVRGGLLFKTSLLVVSSLDAGVERPIMAERGLVLFTAEDVIVPVVVDDRPEAADFGVLLIVGKDPLMGSRVGDRVRGPSRILAPSMTLELTSVLLLVLLLLMAGFRSDRERVSAPIDDDILKPLKPLWHLEFTVV